MTPQKAWDEPLLKQSRQFGQRAVEIGAIRVLDNLEQPLAHFWPGGVFEAVRSPTLLVQVPRELEALPQATHRLPRVVV